MTLYKTLYKTPRSHPRRFHSDVFHLQNFGSRYQCDCWDGAESVVQDGNPICIDIDECALEYCKGGTCINRPGGFDCR